MNRPLSFCQAFLFAFCTSVTGAGGQATFTYNAQGRVQTLGLPEEKDSHQILEGLQFYAQFYTSCGLRRNIFGRLPRFSAALACDSVKIAVLVRSFFRAVAASFDWSVDVRLLR